MSKDNNNSSSNDTLKGNIINVSYTTPYSAYSNAYTNEKTNQYSFHVTYANFNTSLSSSIFPDPHILEGYKNIDPSFPDRLLKIVEDKEKHKNSVEIKKLMAKSRESFFDRSIIMSGQIFAFILTIYAMKKGVELIMHGEPVKGTFFAGFGLAPIVAAFIWRSTRAIKSKKANKK